jgi:Uma2 family endonuclease
MKVTEKQMTLNDLMREPGKAELVGGRIVRYMATGYWPHKIAFRILLSLNEFAMRAKQGEAFGDNLGFAVPILASGRESFNPDASFYSGPLPKNKMWFIEGAPTLAMEVRSDSDKGAVALREMADKRADYFEAGTLVVWDVDPMAECIYVYRATSRDIPATYGRGQQAEAEPAVPGWKIAVDSIFQTE